MNKNFRRIFLTLVINFTLVITVMANGAVPANILDVTDITVHKMEIDIPEDSWNEILAAPLEEAYYSANITYDGISAKNVAFRTKGNSTLRDVASSDSDRYSFKIKIDKYVDDQTLNGMNELVLNNGYADASYLREYLTYSASNALGLITPQTEFTQLYINGELYGLYLYVESYDGTFMDKNTTDKDAILYKADSDTCSLTTADDLKGFEVKEGDDADLTNLKTLQEALSSKEYTKIEKILDTSSVLKYAALSYFTGNYDSYLGDKAHNYFLLYDGGKIKMVGWDYNMSFNGYPKINSLSLTPDTIFSQTADDQRPLVSVLLENEKYQKEFDGYVDYLSSWFAEYDTAIAKLAINLREYVANDPTAFYSVEDFDMATSDTGLALVDIQDVSMDGQPQMQQRMQPGMQNNMDSDRPPMPAGTPDGNSAFEGRGQRPNGPLDKNGPNAQMGNDLKAKKISIVDFIRLRLESLQ